MDRRPRGPPPGFCARCGTQDYRIRNAQVLKEQLRKGGSHLAQLLNAIEWEVSP